MGSFQYALSNDDIADCQLTAKIREMENLIMNDAFANQERFDEHAMEVITKAKNAAAHLLMFARNAAIGMKTESQIQKRHLNEAFKEQTDTLTTLLPY